GEPFGDGGAQFRRIFADTGGEDEAVDARHGSGQHPGIQANAGDEIVDGKLRPRVARVLQLPHVVADTGEASEAAVAVKKVLDLLRRHTLFRSEIKYHAGINLARPRAHRQAVQRGKAHGAFDAVPALDGAHRGAAAEM